MAFRIVRADLTELRVDAIVNPANPEPVYGDGTDRAVYRAAGEAEMLAARRAIGPLAYGQTAVTRGFALPARWVIHAVSPFWEDGAHGEEQLLRLCYDNALQAAKLLGCREAAFPLLASGSCGFPGETALRIAMEAFSAFLEKEELEILLVVFDGESFALSGKFYEGIDAYIDAHSVAEKIAEEYPGEAALEAEGEYEGRSRRNMPDALREAGRPQREKRPARRAAPRAGRYRREDAYPAADLDDTAALYPPAGAPRPTAPRSLDDVIREAGETFQQSLFRWIDARGLTDAEVYRRANLDRKHFSKIRSNPDYQPKKQTAVALALALRLNLDETRDLLARAGYALSPSSRFDLIIAYCIEQGVYDSYSINLALFEHDQPLLGA